MWPGLLGHVVIRPEEESWIHPVDVRKYWMDLCRNVNSNIRISSGLGDTIGH